MNRICSVIQTINHILYNISHARSRSGKHASATSSAVARILGGVVVATFIVSSAWAQTGPVVVSTMDTGPFSSIGSFVLKIENKTKKPVSGVFFQVSTADGSAPVAEAPTVPAGQTEAVNGTLPSGVSDFVVFTEFGSATGSSVSIDFAYQVASSSSTANFENIPENDMIVGVGHFDPSSNTLTRIGEPVNSQSGAMENPADSAVITLHNYTTADQAVEYAVDSDTGVLSTGVLTLPPGTFNSVTLSTPSDFSVNLNTTGVDASITLGGGQTLTDTQLGIAPIAGAAIGVCYLAKGCKIEDKAGVFTKAACKTNAGQSWLGPGGVCQNL